MSEDLAKIQIALSQLDDVASLTGKNAAFAISALSLCTASSPQFLIRFIAHEWRRHDASKERL